MSGSSTWGFAVRVLLSTTSGAGHFRPLLPFARALSRAGHELACAAPTEARTMVEREGLSFLPFAGVAGDHPDRLAVLGALPTLSDDEATHLFGSEIFGRLNTTYALPGAKEAVAAFRPDLVLHESAEIAVRLVAEAEGIPKMAVNPSLRNTAYVVAMSAGIAAIREGLGLDPDENALAALRSPGLSLFPAAFDVPSAVDDEIHRYRDPDLAPSGAAGDLVYVTLGSEAHSLPFFVPLLREVVEGALAGGLPVLVSTGADVEPGALAGLEGDLTVERWVDQAQVLARARVLVCHAGAGSTLGALTAGVPIVAVPLFADQPDNAERVEATGTGRRVDPGPDLTGRVADAVRDLIGQRPPGSDRIAADIAALPPTDDSVVVLESLVG